jgi:hypothetical protein
MSLPSILPAWIALIMGLWKSGILFIAVQVIALELRAAASEAIMRLALVQVGLRKNHETFEFHAKAIKFEI